MPTWGISESPLVEGDRVIVTPGGSGASVVALEKTKGDLLWKSQSDPAGYSSPIAFDAARIAQAGGVHRARRHGLDMKTGELQWRYDKVANRTANIATPIVSTDTSFSPPITAPAARC